MKSIPIAQMFLIMHFTFHTVSCESFRHDAQKIPETFLQMREKSSRDEHEAPKLFNSPKSTASSCLDVTQCREMVDNKTKVPPTHACVDFSLAECLALEKTIQLRLFVGRTSVCALSISTRHMSKLRSCVYASKFFKVNVYTRSNKAHTVNSDLQVWTIRIIRTTWHLQQVGHLKTAVIP